MKWLSQSEVGRAGIRARYGGHVATVLQPRECVPQPGDQGV